MVGFGPADLGSNPSRATSQPKPCMVVYRMSFMEQVDESPSFGMSVESYEHTDNRRTRSRTNGQWNRTGGCMRWL
jgi:hypothetical protein